uniref:Paired domain-containing protein n=1 Tax=Scylla olivacea TaxID=85551 RepID=A0A0P4WJ53_SCYOL
MVLGLCSCLAAIKKRYYVRLMPPGGAKFSLYFVSYHPLNLVKMVTSKNKLKEVVILHRAGHDLSFIAHQTGVQQRTVQCLVRRFKDAREADALASLPKSGRPHKTIWKTCALISQQVLKYPKLTALELKVEKKSELLEDVSLRNIQQIFHDDLGYKLLSQQKATVKCTTE